MILGYFLGSLLCALMAFMGSFRNLWGSIIRAVLPLSLLGGLAVFRVGALPIAAGRDIIVSTMRSNPLDQTIGRRTLAAMAWLGFGISGLWVC